MINIRQFLESNIDEKYRNFSADLNPGQKYPILGVRVPVLRKIARSLVKENGIDAMKSIKDDSYEEVLLQGMVIAYSKLPETDKKPFLDRYLDKCDDGWSLVDSIVGSFRIKDRDVWHEWVSRYVLSGKVSKVRFAYVMMMKLLDDRYIESILSAVVNNHSEQYYIQMAKAWLLATAAINYYDEVRKILADGELDRFTHNKTIQKMIESYRISDEHKDEVRRMKK